jgi:glucoamylase
MRSLSLGNGVLEVNFDAHGQIVDFYYPNVGLENQTSGNTMRVGFCLDGSFTWIDRLQCSVDYLDNTMIGQTRLNLGPLEIIFTDFVDRGEPVLTRVIGLTNSGNGSRSLRVFLHQNFSIFDNDVGDTAAFDPTTHFIVHYKGKRYIAARLMDENGKGFDQYAVGRKNTDGLGNIVSGTYLDAEDCKLSGNPIQQGFVDSVVSSEATVGPHSSTKLYYWLVAGKSLKEVNRFNKTLTPEYAELELSMNKAYWSRWCSRGQVEGLPDAITRLYNRSLVVIKSQTDANGSVVASTDFSIEKFSHDSYNYVWPRDAAYVVNAMDQAGYPSAALKFFEFASKIIWPGGYFAQKYNPNGSLASSWHPWVSPLEGYLPIQQDETALVVWSLVEHYFMYRDIDHVAPFYKALLKPAANFMMSFVDNEKGLPRPSYDLWEERFGVHIHTATAVQTALRCASKMALEFGDDEFAKRCSVAAGELEKGIMNNMVFDGRFVRRVTYEGSDLKPDLVVDSAILTPALMGMVDPYSPVAEKSEEVAHGTLKTRLGGFARYENDYYMRSSQQDTGNPWIITTLWVAQNHLLRNTQQDKAEALRLMQWCAEHALPSGVLPEQFDMVTGEPLSVSPLTWSHAEFVRTVQLYLGKKPFCLSG